MRVGDFLSLRHGFMDEGRGIIPSVKRQNPAYRGDECKHALQSEVMPSEHFAETLHVHGGSMDHYVLEGDGHVPGPWHNAGRDLLNSNQKLFQMHQSGRFPSRARKGVGEARVIPAILVASLASQ